MAKYLTEIFNLDKPLPTPPSLPHMPAIASAHPLSNDANVLKGTLLMPFIYLTKNYNSGVLYQRFFFKPHAFGSRNMYIQDAVVDKWEPGESSC